MVKNFANKEPAAVVWTETGNWCTKSSHLLNMRNKTNLTLNISLKGKDEKNLIDLANQKILYL
jgi:hypothetical protein